MWGADARYLTHEEKQVGFSGANMVFKRDVLLNVNGFDAGFGVGSGGLPVGEDTELCNRLARAGCVFWYASAAVVYHYVSPGGLCLSSRFRRWYWNGKCRQILDLRNGMRVPLLWAWLKLPLYLFIVGPIKLMRQIFFDPSISVQCLQEFAYLCGKAVAVSVSK